MNFHLARPLLYGIRPSVYPSRSQMSETCHSWDTLLQCPLSRTTGSWVDETSSRPKPRRDPPTSCPDTPSKPPRTTSSHLPHGLCPDPDVSPPPRQGGGSRDTGHLPLFVLCYCPGSESDSTRREETSHPLHATLEYEC